MRYTVLAMEPQAQYWNIGKNTAALLQALIHALQPARILEIGTSNGYSAIQMGKVAKEYGGTIQTIEFFPERIKLARINIEKAGLAKTIEVVTGDALEILQTFITSPTPSFVRRGKAPFSPSYEGGAGRGSASKQFDFVFIDANKEEYADYFKYSMQMISPGGIIIADNTVSHRNKLSAFFEAIKKEPRAHALELDIGTGVIVVKIK